MVSSLSLEERTVCYLLLLPQTTGRDIDERLRPLLDREGDFERLKEAVPVNIEHDYPHPAFRDILTRNLFLGGPYVDQPHRVLERALRDDGNINTAIYSLIKDPSGKGKDYAVDLRHTYCLFPDSDFRFYFALARERGLDERSVKHEFTAYIDALERSLLAFYGDMARALGIEKISPSDSVGYIPQLVRMVHKDPRMDVISRSGVLIKEEIEMNKGEMKDSEEEAERIIASVSSSRPEYCGIDIHDKEPRSLRPMDVNDLVRHFKVFMMIGQTRKYLINMVYPLDIFSPADKHIISVLGKLTPEKLKEYAAR